MSFAGIVFRNHEIIAFADSKGTIITGNGDRFPDQEKQEIRKIFEGKDWIGISYGTNAFYIVDGKSTRRIRLEEWMETQTDYTPFEVAENLRNLIIKNECHTAKVYFIFGFLRNEKCSHVYAEVTYGALHYSEDTVTIPCAFYGGDTGYINHFSFYSEPFLSGNPDIIRHEIERVVKWKNKSDQEYNPVGLPIRIRVWNVDSGERKDV